MRKLWHAAAVAVLLLAASVSQSLAAPRWMTEEIGWTLTYTGGPGADAATAINVHDTTYAALGAADDTTGNFVLNKLVIGADNAFARSTVADTLVLGFLTIVVDTTVAFSSTVTEIAYTVEVINQKTAAVVHTASSTATSVGVTSGSDIAFLPLFIIEGANIDEAGVDGELRFGLLPAGKLLLRVITTAVSGTGFPMAKAYVSWLQEAD